MVKLEKFLLGVIVGMAFVMVVVIMSSCSVARQGGYGCPGPANHFVGYK